MATAAISAAQIRDCAHCGLPVAPPSGAPPSRSRAPERIFCCHACRMAYLIIGNQEQGEHACNLLRLGFGALLAMNVMMISLLLYSGSVEMRAVPLFRLILLALAAPALAILIPPLLSGALSELAARRMSLDLLIALGSLCAFSVSAANALRGTGEVYFDTATMLPVLVTVGKLVEASAKRRATDLLHALETLLPKTALLVTPAGSEEVALDSLRPADLVRVRPGERIPVDGRILEGSSCIEEAAFSGEFLPRSCAPGDEVLAGTVNGTGPLLVQAQRTGRQLLLRGIAELVQQAWRNPASSQRIAQQAASLFLPLVLGLAAAAALCWSLSGNTGQALLSALSVLVVACPCTMGIATPLATSLAIARAARAGIVVRGGGAMEGIARIDTLFFDKTGTVTSGLPVLEEIELLDPQLTKEELLGRLATLESASEHPLGRAVVARARASGVLQGRAERVEAVPGSGISGAVTWKGVTKEVRAGSGGFLEGSTDRLDTCGSAVHVAWEGRLRGRLYFCDTIRPDAPHCIAALRESGLECVLLSGDRLAAAAAVAGRVGIGMVEAPRTPAQKLEAVKEAMASGKTVAMVGDGVNDAPALAAAHTGVALGAGMELARQAGNVVILSGRLSQLPWLISLSQRTAGIIRGNFAWSFAYNAIALAAAAAGLLHPLLAALAMVASSLTVLGNSLRIAAFPEEEQPASPPGRVTAASTTFPGA